MSGIDFDRQAFVAPTEQPAPQQPRALGLIILAIAVMPNDLVLATSTPEYRPSSGAFGRPAIDMR